MLVAYGSSMAVVAVARASLIVLPSYEAAPPSHLPLRV